jgi:hypothetical protein
MLLYDTAPCWPLGIVRRHDQDQPLGVCFGRASRPKQAIRQPGAFWISLLGSKSRPTAEL